MGLGTRVVRLLQRTANGDPSLCSRSGSSHRNESGESYGDHGSCGIDCDGPRAHVPYTTKCSGCAAANNID